MAEEDKFMLNLSLFCHTYYVRCSQDKRLVASLEFYPVIWTVNPYEFLSLGVFSEIEMAKIFLSS